MLVAVIETPSVTLLMDCTWLNMARDPRIAEIEALFQRWDAMGLLDTARYCTKLVPETCNLAAEEALGVIVDEGKPAPLDLPQFLKLLSHHGFFDLAKFRAPAAAMPS